MRVEASSSLFLKFNVSELVDLVLRKRTCRVRKDSISTILLLLLLHQSRYRKFFDELSGRRQVREC